MLTMIAWSSSFVIFSRIKLLCFLLLFGSKSLSLAHPQGGLVMYRIKPHLLEGGASVYIIWNLEFFCKEVCLFYPI